MSLELWTAALLQPWRAWPRILAERRDASWLYLAIGVESLLAQPEASLRAAWAIGRRGATAIMPLLRLGSMQIMWAIGLTAALALLLSVFKKGFAFGELLSMTTWAYAPKLLVTLAFSVAWLLGWDGFFTLPYWALSALAVGGSVACLLRAYDDSGPLPQLPSPRGLALVVAATCAVTSAAVMTARAHPERFRPVGRGDLVQALHFDALTGPSRTIAFPADKPVVIDFWASWCGPCVDGLPDWQKLRSEDVTLISANVEPDNGVYVKSFLRENNFTFDVVTASHDLQSRFQVDTLPTLVVLSRDGEVVRYQVGATDLSHAVNDAERSASLGQ